MSGTFNKLLGVAGVLKEYFGINSQGYGDKIGIASFVEELKELGDEEKLEMARGAASELGLSQEQVSFKLS